jgi:outer membrane protein TolC
MRTSGIATLGAQACIPGLRLAFLLSSLLTGCAHYTPAPLADRAALAPGVEALPGIPAGPLTVAQVVALAVRRDPNLVAARAKRGLAQAQIVQAGVLPNPSFNGAFLPLISGVGDVPAWSLGLAQDVKSLLTYRPRRRAARDGAAQVEADLLWQEWQVAAQARQLAVDIVVRERSRPLLDQAFTLLSRRYQVTQTALAAGNATLVTTAPSALGFQQARANLQALDQAQLQARHRLNALLALAPDAVVPLAPIDGVAPMDAVAVRAMLANLPDRRPDLLALRFGYAAQDESLRAAILAQFPDLILGAVSSSDNSRVVNAGPNAQIGLPVFDRNQGNVAIARATRAQLGAEYAARLASATGEVGALLGELEQLRPQIAVVRRDLPAARVAAERASAAFGRSALDERAYVDLVTNRFAKEQELLTLQLGLLDRQIAIDALIGTGLPPVETLGLYDPGVRGAAR